MTTPEKVLAIASSQLGISESPAGSNRVKYNEWYGINGIPWCATFVSWVLHKAKLNELKGLQNEQGSAYCPYIEQYYRRQKRWTTIPQKGAIILFDWGRDGVSDHIGFVEQVITNNKVICIEGNTSASNNSNGGQVQRRTRYKKQIRGYGIPLYQSHSLADLSGMSYEELGKPQLYVSSPMLRGVIVEHVQRRLIKLGFPVGSSGVDGWYGRDTESAVKAFQRSRGLDADGWVGVNTWTALFDI